MFKRRCENSDRVRSDSNITMQRPPNSSVVDSSQQTNFSKSFSEHSNYAKIETSLNQSNKITVIIPTLNEEKNISSIVKELHQLGFTNILMIDGNSTDGTVEIAQELGVNVLHQNGKGKGEALRQAFDYTQLSDWVVMLDADGSMDPKEIFRFLEHLNNGIDVVKGSRFMPFGFSEDMTLFRRMGNAVFVHLVNLIWGAKYTDLCYGFAAFKKEALLTLQPYLESKNFEIETELFIKAKKLHLNVIEVPSIELRRKYGKSNLNSFKDGFLIFKTIMHEALFDTVEY